VRTFPSPVDSRSWRSLRIAVALTAGAAGPVTLFIA